MKIVRGFIKTLVLHVLGDELSKNPNTIKIFLFYYQHFLPVGPK